MDSVLGITGSTCDGTGSILSVVASVSSDQVSDLSVPVPVPIGIACGSIDAITMSGDLGFIVTGIYVSLNLLDSPWFVWGVCSP